jgi:hypothetical protein
MNNLMHAITILNKLKNAIVIDITDGMLIILENCNGVNPIGHF